MSERIRRQAAGADAVRLALAAGEPVRLVLVRRGAAHPDLVAAARAAGATVRTAGARALWRFARPRTSEIVALIGPAPRCELGDLMRRPGVVWLVAGARYPGNVGFAIRTAEVSGAAGIVVDGDLTMADRRRALRASMRADRLFPVLWETSEAACDAAAEAGRPVIAVEDTGDAPPWQTDLSGDLLLVVGGESGGVPTHVLARSRDVVRLPVAGFVPSYNLQAAMAAVMGERLRQA